ncbi:FusB/FusC family EF-G-binding protein [Paenibacillus turpanensis]|uniref:FusB/FusC family EF-G-binding protein n=1 Tax=Paenibacillus turpanensis TaxID=2689078 RepID=UPI00140C04C8|nr:FusB/FusC family EF-G-binding protein [Paenibacillus turpanensis]
MEPFLQNHQYNRVVAQAKAILYALQSSSDRKVVEAARYNAWSKVMEACSGLDRERMALIERMQELQTSEEFQVYLNELAGYAIPFPDMTERVLKSLFPKVKKLRPPELERFGNRPLTYLGWSDQGASRMFLVYNQPDREGAGGQGRLVGIEGRFTAGEKKGVCAFCNKIGEAALFTAVTKKRMGNNPDYYKAVGQYICFDSDACNARITDLTALDVFFAEVTG